MSPDQWLNQKYSGEYFSGNFDHLKTIIKDLGLKPDSNRVITVGGTNGKGQTVRVLAELFKSAGRSCFLLTSPHIKKVNERFQLNRVDVSDDLLMSAFIYISEATKEINISYFEFLYLVYLKLVQELDPEIILQEVGLGGRLDATNAIEAGITAICSISRDHQEILGNKYREILFEKLGITRKGCRLFTSLELTYLRQITKDWCQKLDICWWDSFEHGNSLKTLNFSDRNIKLAQKIYESSQGTKAPIIEFALAPASRRTFDLDGASWSLYPTHNVDGLRKLIQFLGEEQYNIGNLVLFAPSKRNIHDLQTMVKILLKRFKSEQLRLVHFKHYKALEHTNLEKLSSIFGIKIVEDIKKFTLPKNSDTVLVIGSNYFLGEFDT